MTLSGVWGAITGAKVAIFTGLACVALCLPLGYCNGYQAAMNKSAAERAAANVIAVTTARNADEVAAVERVDSALSIAKTKQELTDAIATVPDTLPDDARVALGCQRLRQAGTLDAHLPAICGPSGSDGSKAPAKP